jgi:integrase
MAVAKITKRTVESVPRGGFVWDTVVKGFGVRRQTTEDVFYIVRYRFPGRPQVFFSIGRHGGVSRNGVSLTPDTARTEAKRLLGMVADGINPSDERQQERDKAKQLSGVETFKTAADRYLAKRQQTMKPRAFLEIERHLLKHAEPLHSLRITEINRLAIARLLDQIETGSNLSGQNRGGPAARNRVRSSLSVFFNWIVKQELLDANPVQRTDKAAEVSRDRVLTDAELAEVWAALPQDHFGDIVRLLVLTGQRREEIGSLRWSEVDPRKGLIVLPPERVKNKRKHQVPLSPAARAVIDRQLRRNDREYIFGIGKGGFSSWSDCKASLDQAILDRRREANPKAKPLPAWRLHDLRRTAVTGMNELGVLPHIVETIVNHVSGHRGGIAGIYNHARHEGETRLALEKWGEYVEELTSQQR